MPQIIAREFVEAGRAVPEDGNGRIRAVRLIETARTHARRIGEPTGASLMGTKFSGREKLDNGHTVWKHLRRATDVLE